MEKPYTHQWTKTASLKAATDLLCTYVYYTYSYKGGLKYSGIGFPTLEFSHIHKTIKTNFRAKQHQQLSATASK